MLILAVAAIVLVPLALIYVGVLSYYLRRDETEQQRRQHANVVML